MSSLTQKRSRRRKQGRVLERLIDGVPMVLALQESLVSGPVFRRWWLYDESFRRKWDLAHEVLRDSLVRKAVERVKKGDEASLPILLAVLDGRPTIRKLGRADRALHARWFEEVKREAKKQQDLFSQVEAVELGRAAPIGAKARRGGPDSSG